MVVMAAMMIPLPTVWNSKLWMRRDQKIYKSISKREKREKREK